MCKKCIILAVILLVVAGGVLAFKFFLGGDEDTWFCQDSQWVRHGNPSAPMPTTGCGEGDGVSLANPASVNCAQKGGAEETRTDDSGGQYGVCKFTDGSECDSWKFFRGECQVGESLN